MRINTALTTREIYLHEFFRQMPLFRLITWENRIERSLWVFDDMHYMTDSWQTELSIIRKVKNELKDQLVNSAN